MLRTLPSVLTEKQISHASKNKKAPDFLFSITHNDVYKYGVRVYFPFCLSTRGHFSYSDEGNIAVDPSMGVE